MENDEKLILGKILGEIYRLQKANDPPICKVSDGHIYALLHGIESAVEEELESIGFISSEKVKNVMDVIEPIWMDKKRTETFKGYYDIRKEIEDRKVDRGEAIRVIKFLKANGQFVELINKMDSEDSPAECRNFNLTDWDV